MIIDESNNNIGDQKMKTPVESLVAHEEVVEELDFVELGDVTEETKGNPIGYRSDGGFGLKF